MYLKEIKAHGFKSFADKVNIELGTGISGIVGPNGSGKSNVVDAVRWVLGEQSVKSLRGDGTMTDVIFSGSKSRKAQNVASVTLLFDNSDRYLNVDYSEVAIQRRVYKDGTNEYLLNGERCRLKDITDILLDTGIAKESFNIISQGKIEEIISNKPSERRVIFEEAAGVLKYKKRKEEALRKLERTHDNMNRVDDIIDELKEQIEPLKEQREKAILYKELKTELEQTEIALITHDITELNTTYQINQKRMEILNEEMLEIGSTSRSNEADISKFKVELDRVDYEVNEVQKKWIEKTTELERIHSQKQILLERKKYEVEDRKLHDTIILLKEQELKLETEIHALKEEMELAEKDYEQAILKRGDEEKKLGQVRNEKNKIQSALSQLFKGQTMLEHKITHLRTSIENNSALPYAVKHVLENPKLNGIHDVIGKLFEVEEQYAEAISTSVGGASNYIVVENEVVAKHCIEFLKQNTLGRATFFPMNVIKPKFIDENLVAQLKKMPGFVAIASELVKYQPIYDNIMKNQLGNVIVATNLDSANQISQKMMGRFKIVTLDGELIHVGGSVTGGKMKKATSVVSEKYELERAVKELENYVRERERLEDKMNEVDHALKVAEDKLYLSQKEVVQLEESKTQKLYQLREKEQGLEKVTEESAGTNHILNDELSKEEETIIALFYQVEQEKNDLERLLRTKKKERVELSEHLSEIEFSYRQENSILKEKSKELRALEIEVNRADVKLDHLLSTLSETYTMTYEKAVTMYELKIDIESARNKVSRMKQKLKELGEVNLGAIEEYERIRVRYDFLLSQKEDLTKAEDTLLEIIQEMDDVMEKEFIVTFELIRQNFTETFKELFRGGNADLKLTDENHILETGIEIVASPPGKKLTSISLLSGGEKTFTAISLLFAILKSRPVPFCILDEVEAALDEANVDSFGKYVEGLKAKTQFILITHKKKTMEYADVLYGITMQESGVSKLVSVKLEDINIEQ